MAETYKPSEKSAGAAKIVAAHQPRALARTAPLSVAPVMTTAAPRVEVVNDIEVRTERYAPVGGVLKRAFDIAFAAGALIVLAPLLLLIAVAVRIDSPGKAIFRQERGGLGGRTFRIWKFRTMSVTENRGVVQARHRDARITRLGGFLRRSSWDELPQLVNVLLGDMSIVGPRPHAIEHDIQFAKVDPRYPMRQRARPGITGLAQVSGCRGPTETDDKVRARTGYDAEYVRTWSFAADIKILLATVALLFWKRDPGAL
jgi:putative colanic acid biosynthesis UDP-glucose lipid carrier transferase